MTPNVRRDTSINGRRKGLLKYLKTLPELKVLNNATLNKIAFALARGFDKSKWKGAFDNREIRLRLGFEFPYRGRNASLSNREVDKFYHFYLLVSEHQNTESQKEEKLAFANELKDLQQYRAGYKKNRPAEEKLAKRFLKNSQDFEMTGFLKELVCIVNKQINHTERRYKDQSFKLVATFLKPFFFLSKDGLDWKQIKARINKTEKVKK